MKHNLVLYQENSITSNIHIKRKVELVTIKLYNMHVLIIYIIILLNFNAKINNQ